MDPVCVVLIQQADKDKVVEVKRRWPSLFYRTEPLHVGLLARIPRPPTRKNEIDASLSNVERDLAKHLRQINYRIRLKCQQQNIPSKDTVHDHEPILTGRGTVTAAGPLALSPNLWFRCGSGWAEDIVRDEVGGLSWTRHYGLGDKIRIGLRAAVPAADPAFPVPRRLRFDRGFQLPHGYTLYLNVECPGEGASACGLLCSIAVKQGEILVHHSGCRIGGVLSVKDGDGVTRLVGITSGHALLDKYLTNDMGNPSSLGSEDEPGRSRGRIGRLLRATAGQKSRPTPSTSRHWPQPSPLKLSREAAYHQKINEADWVPINGIHSINWLGGGWETVKEFQFPFAVPQMERLAPDADFALLQLPSDFSNTFQVGAEDTQSVTGILMDKDITDDRIHVVLAAGDVVLGTVLGDQPNLHLRGRLFPARKLQLERPLAMGVSGCWVVQSGKLCGMISLIYEDEPFAYMITAEKLIQDIKKTLGTKVEVNLPDLLEDHLGESLLDLTLPQSSSLQDVPSPPSQPVVMSWRRSFEDVENSQAVRLLESSFITPGARVARASGLPTIITDRGDNKILHEMGTDNSVSDEESRDQDERLMNIGTVSSRDGRGRVKYRIEQLTQALVPSPMDKSKYFMPAGALEKILVSSTVEKDLDILLPGTPDNDQLVRYICTNTVDWTGRSHTARKIFAILLLIGKPTSIQDFQKEGLSDADLPFRRSNANGANFQLETLDIGDTRLSVRAFDNWSPLELQLFESYQWYMLSPFFGYGKQNQTLFYRLHERSILPFIEYEVYAHGGFSSIRRARIHPAHHDFHGVTKSDYFAIKMLYNGTEVHLRREIEAHQKFQHQPRLGRMLASFEFQDNYYLVLPWADGGNLIDMWTAHPEPQRITPGLLRWFLGECVGLAQGLAAIHVQRTKGEGKQAPAAPEPYGIPRIKIESEESEFGDLESEEDGGFILGRHGDIKPQNILCFGERDGDSSAADGGYGTLKISDFGVTTFHSAHSAERSKPSHLGRTPTYRAPEFDIPGSAISRASDVWSLGCVFLEFATWLLFGWSGVQEFVDARLKGDHSEDLITEDKFFIFEQATDSARVKPEVTQWIGKLRQDTRGEIHALDRLLGYIQYSLLQVDPGMRDASPSIVKYLEDVQDQQKEPMDLKSAAKEPGMRTRMSKPALREPMIQARDDVENLYASITKDGQPVIILGQSKHPVLASKLPPAYEQTEPVEIKTTEEFIEERRTQEEYTRHTQRRTIVQTPLGARRAAQRVRAKGAEAGKSAAVLKNDLVDSLKGLSARELADEQANLLAQLGAITELQLERAGSA